MEKHEENGKIVMKLIFLSYEDKRKSTYSHKNLWKILQKQSEKNIQMFPK